MRIQLHAIKPAAERWSWRTFKNDFEEQRRPPAVVLTMVHAASVTTAAHMHAAVLALALQLALLAPAAARLAAVPLVPAAVGAGAGHSCYYFVNYVAKCRQGHAGQYSPFRVPPRVPHGTCPKILVLTRHLAPQARPPSRSAWPVQTRRAPPSRPAG